MSLDIDIDVDVDIDKAIADAAKLIADADSIIIAAGAGMGVDSNLPDFRGENGFWNAYPALATARIPFHQIASPHYFDTDPELAWGFYGHRLQLYRATEPNASFRQLQDIAKRLPEGAFVCTSNVDGHFQKAGFFDGGIIERHGSIHYLQCLKNCNFEIWPATKFQPEIDEAACRLTSPLPRCPRCAAVARPNLLMFNDFEWMDDRLDRQNWEFQAWRANLANPVVIEIGAGTQIQSIRNFAAQQKCPLIRINPRDWHPGNLAHCVSVPLGAAQAMNRIVAALAEQGFWGES